MIAAMAVEIFVWLYIVAFGLSSALAIFMLVRTARRMGAEDIAQFDNLDETEEDPGQFDPLEQ